MRNSFGSIIGGLVGGFRLDWLQINKLWVDENFRSKGYGKQLMMIAEKAAFAAAVSHITLWAQTFQAPGFYSSLGYVECGRIHDHPKGYDAILFVKWLS